MALIIRLRQQGRINRQTYRVVVADEKSPRDGKYVEMLGWYNPNLKDKNLHIDAERLLYWVGRGAQVSEKVEHLTGHVAPQVVSELHHRKHARQVKRAAKRRTLARKK